MSNFVFVLDTNKQPCDPIPPGQARRLLSLAKAAVYKRYPFTLILKYAAPKTTETKNYQLKIDPGSKTTGLAILQDNKMIWGAELTHRGGAIKNACVKRKAVRRNRRQRLTRYRQPRFLNRRRPTGWLPPSLLHRVLTTRTWVHRLGRYCPISSIAIELVRFDTQKLQNPEISGVEYQQGTLAGYEIREFLLEKWGRQCAYCGVKGVTLQIEHIHPKSKGGSDRVSNLSIACNKCNKAKDDRDIRDFLAGKPDVLNRVLVQAKQPLKDAAAVNTTRKALFEALKSTELPVITGTGGQTKYNRTRLGLPKSHWIDAACVGDVVTVVVKTCQPLLIEATGHGNRQMARVNKHGFPVSHKQRRSALHGWKTGDLAKSVIPKGKYKGVYPIGRVVAKKGAFLFAPPGIKGKARISVNHKYLTPIQRRDGYSYSN